MIIRYLTQDDISQHDRISSQAFVYPCKIGSPESVLPAEKVLGAFDDDNKTLFADFELLEKKCYYDGGLLTCAAIAGVAAKPEHRGKGAVKALFDRLFADAACDISILYPFSEKYYRKYGYERAGESIGAVIPFSALCEIKRNTDVTLYEGENTEKLLVIYNRCARGYNLCFARESASAFSADPYFSQKYTYIYKDGGFVTVRIDRKAGAVHVDEIYFDSRESMLGILGFLRNFESNQKKLCFRKLPADTPLLNVISEIQDCDIKLHNVGSVRVLNIENVLRAHKYPLTDGSFTIKAGDDIFAVTVTDGRALVSKDMSAVPDAVMDTGTASKIILSGTADAEYCPGVTVINPHTDFFRMFPPKVSFFSDEF